MQTRVVVAVAGDALPRLRMMSLIIESVVWDAAQDGSAVVLNEDEIRAFVFSEWDKKVVRLSENFSQT